MYSDWVANFAVVFATAITVALAVMVHYEGLRWMSQRLTQLPSLRRRKVLFGVYGVILLHVVEIWLFGVSIWMLLEVSNTGHLAGITHVGFLDAVYLSAVTFSTVGYGDMVPVGAVRFLAGTEALTGFILITWSASFLYLEMQEFWRRH